MNLDRIKTYGRLAARLLGLAAVVGAVLAVGLLGWQWQSTVTVRHVAVSGAQHAPVDSVRHLARVDSGTVMERIDGALVADRVSRHPWVETAEITKQRARRTLLVSVKERSPAALVVDGSGQPVYYLDAAGYAMPRVDSTGYDVPLVRGLDAEYHPVRRLAPPSLRAVLDALPATESEALIGELAVQADSSVQLLTVPLADYDPLPVRLGTGNVRSKLRRLDAFSEQVLRTTPNKTIGEIDLRFDGQIVTREHPIDG